jgi:uncharacterized protein YbjT (DUF2867 family)
MILVTGVTGKTGGEVARQLAAAGIPFRALVRNPDKAEAVRPLATELVIGDMADPAVLRRAVDGVSRALLVLPNIEQQLALEKQFVDAAVAAGMEQLVYLSSLESLPESRNPITRAHVAAETHLRQAGQSSGLAWTMIRPTFFMQSFLTSAARIRDRGELVLAAGNGTLACTDLRDVGEIIVACLSQSGHRNQSYDLTGPELLNLTEIASQFSKVLGYQVRYVDQPVDEFRERLRSVGMNPWRVDAVVMELQSIAAGAIDHTTDTVQKLLGRPPHSLQQFIADHAAAFRRPPP